MDRKFVDSLRKIPSYFLVAGILALLEKAIAAESNGDWELDYGFNPAGEYKRHLENNYPPEDPRYRKAEK